MMLLNILTQTNSNWPWWKWTLFITALLFAAISMFLWIWNVVKAKQMREGTYKTIKVAPTGAKIKLPCRVDRFIAIFGGLENIVSAKVISNTRIKITVVDSNEVVLEELQKIKNHGILEQTNAIVISIDANNMWGIVMADKITELLKKQNSN